MNKIPAWVKDTDLAYIAGFIDADGCIGLNTSRNTATVHGMAHYPRISGFSIDRHALEFVQSVLGGRITDSQGPGQRRIHYRWAVNGIDAIECAKVLIPFLRIKKAQAQLLVEFDTGRLYHSRGNKKNKMPIEEFTRRQLLVTQSRYLNQRGYLEERPK